MKENDESTLSRNSLVPLKQSGQSVENSARKSKKKEKARREEARERLWANQDLVYPLIVQF